MAGVSFDDVLPSLPVAIHGVVIDEVSVQAQSSRRNLAAAGRRQVLGRSVQPGDADFDVSCWPLVTSHRRWPTLSDACVPKRPLFASLH